jgi:hypothetical protein
MRLSRQSVQRIGAAVRAIESGRGVRGGRDDGDAVPCIRLAQVGDAVEDEPGAGEPYIYEADIFTGRWDDDGAARTAVAETIEVWSDVALTADAWVGVLRVGNHWETLGAAGLSDLRYDTSSHQLQKLAGGSWEMITGGQAVP